VPTNKKAITVYLDEHVYKLLAKSAEAANRSISNYVENALATSFHPEAVTMFPDKIPGDRPEK
jgi:predicted HicB family RNase H-like nuclease